MRFDRNAMTTAYCGLRANERARDALDVQMHDEKDDQSAALIRSDTGNAAINHNRIQKAHVQTTMMRSHMI